jgi:quercetin dioxygenase-like cupin family protein
VSRRPRIALLSVLAVCALGGAYAAGASGGTAAPAPVREALATVNNPIGGKGRMLTLSRITVPGHAQLALHHHPGTQIASIQQGTLTYTVVKGKAVVSTGDAEHPTSSRTIRAGQTVNIKTGMWIVEQPTDVHRAQNKGSKPIVILLSTLFPIGSPPSVPNTTR